MSQEARDKLYGTLLEGFSNPNLLPKALAARAAKYGLLVAKKGEAPPEGYVLVQIKDEDALSDGEYFMKKEMVELLRDKTRDQKDDDDFFYENDEISL